MSPHDLFANSDVEDFARHLGLDGSDADLFYESYYQLNTDDEWEEDEYREEVSYSDY